MRAHWQASKTTRSFLPLVNFSTFDFTLEGASVGLALGNAGCAVYANSSAALGTAGCAVHAEDEEADDDALGAAEELLHPMGIALGCAPMPLGWSSAVSSRNLRFPPFTATTLSKDAAINKDAARNMADARVFIGHGSHNRLCKPELQEETNKYIRAIYL